MDDEARRRSDRLCGLLGLDDAAEPPAPLPDIVDRMRKKHLNKWNLLDPPVSPGRVAAKLEAKRLAALSKDTTTPPRHAPLPSIDDVQRTIDAANKAAKGAAAVASAALEKETVRASMRSFCGGLLPGTEIREETKPPAKTAKKRMLTVEDVYTEDQEAALFGRKPEKRRDLCWDPDEVERRGLMDGNALRAQYRDETNREAAWLADVENAERHPIFRVVAWVAYSEFTRMLEVLQATAGKGLLSGINAQWRQFRLELRPRTTPRRSPRLEPQVAPTHAAVTGLVEEIPVPEEYEWDCLVDGLDYNLDGHLTKIWIHKRRRRGRQGWRSWRWRIQVYHVLTGLTRWMTLSEATALALTSSGAPGLLPLLRLEPRRHPDLEAYREAVWAAFGDADQQSYEELVATAAAQADVIDLPTVAGPSLFVGLDGRRRARSASPTSRRRRGRRRPSSCRCRPKDCWQQPHRASRRSWVEVLTDRERRLRAQLQDETRLVLASGTLMRTFRSDMDDGDDGARWGTQEVGYAGIEGRGNRDCDGAYGTGGQHWEADDERVAPALSLQICDLAGTAGVVPGVSVVGRAAAMFDRPVESVVVKMVGAFENAELARVVAIDEVHALEPSKNVDVDATPRIPPIISRPRSVHATITMELSLPKRVVLGERDAATRALSRRAFGISRALPVHAVGCEPACVYHSEQRCVEQLCRRRNGLDYVVVAKSDGPPLHACPVVYTSKVKAKDESRYEQVSLDIKSLDECIAVHRAIGLRRRRETQRARVAAEVDALVHKAAYVELAERMTMRALRAKALRLVASSNKGLGDSPERWEKRLVASELVEARGVWQKRRSAAVFYYNTDPLATPPRFTWEPPATWSVQVPQRDVVVTRSDIKAALVDDETFVAQVVPRLGLEYVPPFTERVWSDDDEDEEVGDFVDWREALAQRRLPQNHADARLARQSKAVDDDEEEEGRVAPAYGSDGWRRLEHHRRGRYWRHLPSARVMHRQHATVLAHDDSWPQLNIIFATPTLPGIVTRRRDEKTWGDKRTNPHPQVLTSTMFVSDAQDDIDRIIMLAKRRASREAVLGAPISLVALVDRGPRETTTGEEYIKRDDFETAIVEGRSVDDMDELRRRAAFAARSGNLSDLEACVDTFNVSLETTDDSGNTLLMLAAQQNDTKILKFLLRRGADINATNYAGNSVLHFAFGYAYDDLGNYLISKGADPAILNKDGCTCYEFNHPELFSPN